MLNVSRTYWYQQHGVKNVIKIRYREIKKYKYQLLEPYVHPTRLVIAKRNLSLIKELEKALREGKELEGKLAEAMGTMADLFQYIHPNDARQKAEEFWERWAEKKFSESGKQ